MKNTKMVSFIVFLALVVGVSFGQTVIFDDNFDTENGGVSITPVDLTNWTENGEISLVVSSGGAGTILLDSLESVIHTIADAEPGVYTISLDLSHWNYSAGGKIEITLNGELYKLLMESINFQTFTFSFSIDSTQNVDIEVLCGRASTLKMDNVLITFVADGTTPPTEPPTTGEPSVLVNALMAKVDGFNLDNGVDGSLDSKLQSIAKAVDDIADGKIKAALGKIKAFINECKAQAGKKLTQAQSDSLCLDANNIIAVLTD